MKFNIPINTTDAVVLAVLLIFFVLGVRAVISFFRTPKASGDKAKKLAKNLKAGSHMSVVLDGMMCGMCEIHIKNAIRDALPDATAVTASHTTGKASFTLGKGMTSADLVDALHDKIDPQGYRILEVNMK